MARRWRWWAAVRWACNPRKPTCACRKAGCARPDGAPCGRASFRMARTPNGDWRCLDCLHEHRPGRRPTRLAP